MITSNNSSTSSTPYIIVYFITSSITFCIICLLFYYIYKHLRTIKDKPNEMNSNRGDINQMNSNGDLNNGWYNMYDYIDIYKSITSKKSGSYNDIENSFNKNTIIGIDKEDIL